MNFIDLKCEEFKTRIDAWETSLKPTESGENTEEAQVCQKSTKFCQKTLCNYFIKLELNHYYLSFYVFKFQGFQKRIDTIKTTLDGLCAEVKTECEKYGEDVKYLADFTSACKKFEPWIEKSEAKKTTGMVKPTNLQEALDQLADANVSNCYFPSNWLV